MFTYALAQVYALYKDLIALILSSRTKIDKKKIGLTYPMSDDVCGVFQGGGGVRQVRWGPRVLPFYTEKSVIISIHSCEVISSYCDEHFFHQIESSAKKQIIGPNSLKIKLGMPNKLLRPRLRFSKKPRIFRRDFVFFAKTYVQ